MRGQLPDIWLVHDPVKRLHSIEVKGIGEKVIPDMVIEAARELDNAGMWQEMGYHCIGKTSQPGITPRPDVALLALLIRYEEMNYVPFDKCSPS